MMLQLKSNHCEYAETLSGIDGRCATAMHRRPTACTVPACCDDGRTRTCNASATHRSHCAHVAVTVARALLLRRCHIACSMRACCDNSRMRICDSSATYRLHCAHMLRRRSHAHVQCIGDSPLALCAHVEMRLTARIVRLTAKITMTVALQLAILRS